MSRWSDFLKATAHKLHGSAVKLRAEKALAAPARARFPINRNLVSEQLREAARLEGLGVRVKALR